MPDPSLSQTRTPEEEPRSESPASGPGISRRRLLGTAGATGLVLGAAGGAVGYAAAPSGATPLTSVGATKVPFHVKHQPGITDPLQSCGHLLAFDLAPG